MTGIADTALVSACPCADIVEDTIVGSSAREDTGKSNLGKSEVDVTAEERNSYHVDAEV